jgi:hypothetical protein
MLINYIYPLSPFTSEVNGDFLTPNPFRLSGNLDVFGKITLTGRVIFANITLTDRAIKRSR